MQGHTQHERSLGLLRQMKAHGFDFSRVHAIEFYAVLPDEGRARLAAASFRGESLKALVSRHRQGGWSLQVSKVMYASAACIDAFEEDLQALVLPLGGELDGWAVSQELATPRR